MLAPPRCCWLLALAGTAPAQILVENAGVVSPELPTLHEQVRVLATDRVTELRVSSQLLVGLDPALEARLTVPWVSRHIDSRPAAHGDLSALGDVSLRVKRSLWQEDAVMASTRWAALVEGTAPTGAHHETLDGIELPRRLQPGAGGLGLGLGTAFTWIRDRHRASAEVFYRHRMRHDGYRLGDALQLGVAYWFRITPAAFAPGATGPEVRLLLELLATLQDDTQRATGDDGSDGAEVWLAPGVQLYGSRRVLLEASLQVPAWQDVDDAFGDRGFAASLGVKILF